MSFTYRELIDVAIGSPESGHVNFYALHVLLSNFAIKLEILDEGVEQDDYLLANMRLQSSLIGKSSRFRLQAGEDEEAPAEAAVAAEEAPPAAEAAPAEAAPEPEAAPAPAEEAAAEAPPEPEAAPDAAPEAAPEPEPEAASEAAMPAPAPEDVVAEAEPEMDPTCPSHGSLRPDRSHLRAEGSAMGIGMMSKLERRISRVELQKEQKEIEMQNYISILTGKLKLTMEQMNNVTHMMIDRKPDPDRMKLLRHVARQLRIVMRAADDEESISWSEEVTAEEGEEEAEEEELVQSESTQSTEMAKPEEELELDQHLCYGPERMLTELLELKTEFCTLVNKVNELSAELMKQDAKRMMEMLLEMQIQMREIKLTAASNSEANQAISSKVSTALSQIQTLKNSLAHLDEIKIDKADVELLLAEKVDFPQLATKVSLEQLEEYKERLEKQFCEMRQIINVNEKNVLQIIDGLRMTLGIDSLELSLKDFREMIEKRVALIAEALHKYMEMTNDDCAAAAGRVKVMQELACLSCDTPCVMRTMERSKLPRPASAKASTSMGPLVTYELGQIRKSGIMGYYRKDEFPHSSNAWTQGVGGPTVPVNKCVPRHAGGMHTIHTADEHMQKVILSKRNTGWL